MKRILLLGCLMLFCALFQGGYLENGGALYFDGNDDLYLFPNKCDVTITTPFSICAWIRETDGNRSDDFWIAKGDYTHGAWNMGIRQRAADSKYYYTLGFQINGAYNNYYLNMDGVGVEPLYTNKWTHVVAVYGGSQGDVSTIKVYINGELGTSATVLLNAGGTVTDITNTDPLELGMWQSGGSNWRGEIDEVQFYKRVLGKAEANSIMQGKMLDGCQLFWDFDDFSRSGSVYDKSGNGVNQARAVSGALVVRGVMRK